MIRLTVELIPHGMETWKQTIMTMEITNEGTNRNNENMYDYQVLTDIGGVRRLSTQCGLDRDVPIDVFLRELLKRTSVMD